MWYVVLTFKDDIFRSDFMRSFMQFQHHNITSDNLSDQNNEKGHGRIRGIFGPLLKILHQTLKEIISINSYQIVFTLQG